jgi:hypothetical protein
MSLKKTITGKPVFAISQIKDLVKFLINAVPERLPFLVPNPCCGLVVVLIVNQ